MQTHDVTRCPACGEPGSGEVPFGERIELRRCAACGLVYAGSYADPSEVYQDGYLSGATDFGIDASHPTMVDMLDRVAETRMGIIDEVTGGRPGSFLDVGCGTGEVLMAARRHGWTATGVEPVGASAEVARGRGLDVHAALLEESGLPEGSYDVAAAFHVLEHMSDGLGFLRLISRWARPGGHVVIECPNWRSFHRRSFGPAWPALRPLEHIAHYTPTTLEAILRRADLEPVLVQTPTYSWEGQTLEQRLRDVGLHRFIRPLSVLGRQGTHAGKPAVMPGPGARVLLRAVTTAYRWGRVGHVTLAIARVPRR